VTAPTVWAERAHSGAVQEGDCGKVDVEDRGDCSQHAEQPVAQRRGGRQVDLADDGDPGRGW
jgi:hypothetical protein